jgi:hypothetical protein
MTMSRYRSSPHSQDKTPEHLRAHFLQRRFLVFAVYRPVCGGRLGMPFKACTQTKAMHYVVRHK